MLQGAERRKVRLPDRGVEIAILDWGGDGPLALLHHANGFCGAMWAPVAARLRSSYRVVALDARGHGDSTAPSSPEAYAWESFVDDVVALAERLASERDRGVPGIALGIGHSFGGTTLAVAAARHRELFGRIVLADPVLVPGPDVLAAMPAVERPPLAELARKRRAVWESRDDVRRAWSRKGHPFESWDRRVLDLYLQEGFRDRPDGKVELKCSPEVEAAVFERNRSIDVLGWAEKLEVPVLLLRAALGHFPPEMFRRFVDAAADARVEDLEAGHLLPMEEPDLLAERALAFACPAG